MNMSGKLALPLVISMALLAGGVVLGRYSAAPGAISLEASPISFSEVENAKAHLQVLAREFVQGIQRYRVAYTASGDSTGARREHALQALIRGRAEFRGTSAEAEVTRELLALLATDSTSSSWVDVYLHFLYNNPTDELVADLAAQAPALAAKCGREDELRAGLTFVQQVPAQTDSVPNQFVARPGNRSSSPTL